MNVKGINSIGGVIREGRKRKGLTQKQLAEKVHVTRQKVNYWENGKSDIYFWDLVDVFQVLDVQMDIKIQGVK